MDVNRSLITQTSTLDSGLVEVTGVDSRGNQAVVHVAQALIDDGTVYLLLDKALDKVRQTREHLRLSDLPDPEG